MVQARLRSLGRCVGAGGGIRHQNLDGGRAPILSAAATVPAEPRGWGNARVFGLAALARWFEARRSDEPARHWFRRLLARQRVHMGRADEVSMSALRARVHSLLVEQSANT